MQDPLINIWGSEPEVQPESPDTDVDVLEKKEEEDQQKSPWKVILYNDEVHTFDEVINQLIKALGCDMAHAEDLTYKVHTEGKAKVYEGSFEDCFEVNSVLKEIQLITEIKG